MCECHNASIIMQSVVILSVIMLNGILQMFVPYKMPFLSTLQIVVFTVTHLSSTKTQACELIKCIF
jgi:hypothetical protein